MLRIRTYSTKSYYEILNITPPSSTKEVKLKFKQLLKLHHPDLNNHLSDEDKVKNNEKYLEIITAYDTLKDKAKKKLYDDLNTGSAGTYTGTSFRNTNEYYSKSGNNSRKSSYMSSKYASTSVFHGMHKDHSNRFDVPHFDYQSHLNKLLKHERRIINKSLSPDQQQKIISALQKSGIILNEETVTKHLLRHVHSIKPLEPDHIYTKNPHVYRPRQDDDDGSFGKVWVIGLGLAGLGAWKFAT